MVDDRSRAKKVALVLALALVGVVAAAAFGALARRRLRDQAPLASWKVAFDSPDSVLWLEDDRLLLANWPDHGEVWQIEPSTRLLEIAFPFTASSPRASTYASHGEFIAFVLTALDTSGARLISTSSGRVLADFPIDSTELPPWDLSPAGDKLALVARDGRIDIHSVDASPTRVFRLPGVHPENAKFSLHGDHLGVEAEGSVHVLALRDGSIAASFSGDLYGFTRRDEVVIGHDRDGSGLKKIDVVTLQGETVRTFSLGVADSPYATLDDLVIESMSEDGTQRSVEIRSLETGLVRRRFVFPHEPLWEGKVSPSGDRFAVVFTDRRVEVWEIPP